MKNLFCIFLLTITAGFLSACGGDEAGKAAESFFMEIVEGSVHEAMEYAYVPPGHPMGEELIKGKLGPAIRMIQEELKAKGGVESIKAKKTEYTNSEKTRAKVWLTMKMKNGDSETSDPVSVIKTDKGWKVDLSR